MAAGGTSFHFTYKGLDSLLHDSSCRRVAIAMALIVMLGEPLIWRNFWVLHGFSTRQCSLVDGIPLQMVHQPQFVDLLVAAEM